jgi:hypothetical protein
MDPIDIRMNPIRVRKLDIPDVNTIFERNLRAPEVLSVEPPVSVMIGSPVVNLPGCVEAHIDDDNQQNLPDDDPRGVRIFCDAGTPSFDPIDYNAEDLDFETNQKIPPVQAPEPPTTPETNAPKIPKCPTEAQELKEPVGTLVDGGTKKITEYRLVGQECIPVKVGLDIPDQIVKAIPTAGSITTTASIAIVATTSALLAKPLADLVLKVVKPTVKKVIKKIAAIRKKKVIVESLQDRRDQQRIRSHAIRKLKGKE